jgi:type VI secretion system lysozyme-like protein
MEPGNQRDHLRRFPGLVAGLAVPLFDRFNEDLDDRRIVEPFRVEELALILESIQRELENLLNTRLPPRQPPAYSWEPVSEPQTVLDYGIPAISPLGAGSPTDTDLLRRTVLAKIVSFEPRLENPALELRGDPEDPAAMIGTLRGSVRLDNISRPVCFPVSLRQHGESAAIAAGEAS